MIKKIILFSFLLLSQCSVAPFAETFNLDLISNYSRIIDISNFISFGTWRVVPCEYSIDNSQQFTAFNQKFTLERVLSETNAIYKVDDITYINLYIDKDQLRLLTIISPDGTLGSLNLNPETADLWLFSDKVRPSIQ